MNGRKHRKRTNRKQDKQRELLKDMSEGEERLYIQDNNGANKTPTR